MQSPMLSEFQDRFATLLLNGKREEIASDKLQLDMRRFRAYARHTRVSLMMAIGETFPVTQRLVGASFFSRMADHFVTAYPPVCGWLSAYGDGFPEFVAQYSAVEALPYLPGVAQLEWARVRAANADATPGLNLGSLAALDPSELETLPLRLHDAASLIHSPYPVFDIWQTHQHADDEHISQIDLAAGPQDVLVTRTGPMEVRISLLSPGDAAFLATLIQRRPFGPACRAAVLAEPEYDMGRQLGELVSLRALAYFAHEQQ